MPDLSDEEEEGEPHTHTTTKPGKWKSRLLVCCGMAPHADPLTAQEVAALQQKMTSIAEKPLVKRILDLNAVILLVVTAFIIGFYH